MRLDCRPPHILSSGADLRRRTLQERILCINPVSIRAPDIKSFTAGNRVPPPWIVTMEDRGSCERAVWYELLPFHRASIRQDLS